MGKGIEFTNKVNEVFECVCDKYCKYPDREGTQEDLNDICMVCDLNDLFDGIKEYKHKLDRLENLEKEVGKGFCPCQE